MNLEPDEIASQTPLTQAVTEQRLVVPRGMKCLLRLGEG